MEEVRCFSRCCLVEVSQRADWRRSLMELLLSQWWREDGQSEGSADGRMMMMDGWMIDTEVMTHRWMYGCIYSDVG